MSPKRKGLGRGLDALLGSSEPAKKPKSSAGGPAAGISTLKIDQLQPNRFQPRSHFDDSGLEELSKSIRTQGVVQPIVVTQDDADQDADPNKYTIIAGERRWRASKLAGLTEVPVVVRSVKDDQQLLELALVENIQRADLNVIEEAEAYRSLSDNFGLSQEEIATRVGKGRTTITNTLRLLRLPDEIQDYLREGRLTAGQARPLLALPSRERQVELAQKAIEQGLTARDLEGLATSPKKEEKKKSTEEDLDVHTRAAREKLTQVLQTKVDIIRKKKSGQVRIHFHSEEELIRLYEFLTQGAD